MYRLSGPRHPALYRKASDEELIVLEHVPSHRGYSPYLMLAPGRGPVDACAASDIGANANLNRPGLAGSYLFPVRLRGCGVSQCVVYRQHAGSRDLAPATRREALQKPTHHSPEPKSFA